jgi:hypothetical protein
MSQIRLGVLYLLALVMSSPAFPWGNDGHHTVGAVADQLIPGTNAEQHVSQLLNGETLEKFAIWADCAKHYCKDWFDVEMQQFVDANPKHHDYHFTDIPIEEDHYFEASIGASPDDIVQIIRQCIDALRGNDTPSTNPHGFSERLALILLAHFVGDIHQPLHVGAAYVDANESYVSPNPPGAEYTTTLGGNYLMLLTSTNLHAYWDSNAVKRAMTKAKAHSPAECASWILQQPQPNWQIDGDLGDWPKKWADEVTPIASNAYTPLQLGTRYQAHDRHGDHPQ